MIGMTVQPIYPQLLGTAPDVLDPNPATCQIWTNLANMSRESRYRVQRLDGNGLFSSISCRPNSFRQIYLSGLRRRNYVPMMGSELVDVII